MNEYDNGYISLFSIVAMDMLIFEFIVILFTDFFFENINYGRINININSE